MIALWFAREENKYANKLSSDEINRAKYDNLHYYYPKFDITQILWKILSQEFNDALVKILKSDK